MTNIAFMSGAAVVSSVSQLNAGQVDAHLIELGRELEPYFAERLALHARLQPLRVRLHREKPSHATWEAWGGSAIESRIEDLLEATDGLHQSIFQASAESVIGLAVKARAAAMCRLSLWDRPFEDLEWDEKVSRNLIDAALAAAGFPPATDAFSVPALAVAA